MDVKNYCLARIWRVLFCITLFAFSFAVRAQLHTESNLTINHIGVQPPGAYLSFTAWSNPNNCVNALIYIDLVDPVSKTLYAHTLSAKLTGNVLRRVDYVKGGDNVCFLRLAEFGS